MYEIPYAQPSQIMINPSLILCIALFHESVAHTFARAALQCAKCEFMKFVTNERAPPHDDEFLNHYDYH